VADHIFFHLITGTRSIIWIQELELMSNIYRNVKEINYHVADFFATNSTVKL